MTSDVSYVDEVFTLEASWVVAVGSHFPFDLDKSLLKNGSDFALVQCILETIPEEENQREGFASFVGPWRSCNVNQQDKRLPFGAYLPESFDKSQ